MTESDLIQMVIDDLEISTEYMDQAALETINRKIGLCVGAAQEYITREGVTLIDSDGDNQLVVMFASFLYRGGDSVRMPQMLRYQLNNRVLQEAITGYNPAAVP